MTRRWAVRLDKDAVESLAELRCAPGAEICVLQQEVWVRGTVLDKSLDRLLRRHPHARRYWITADDQLVSPGRRVPHGYLPAGPWRPLEQWLTVHLPETIAAGRLTRRVPIRLLRSGAWHATNVLVTRHDIWSRYAVAVPQVRLERWFFAASADGRIVVRGTPQPTIPGTRYVEQAGIAVPAGWCWSPAVPAKLLRTMFDVQDADLILACPNEPWERIDGDQFVKATRSAVRATAKAFNND